VIAADLGAAGFHEGLLLLVIETHKARGVNLISLRESIDTGWRSVKMLFGILGALGQYERTPIMERTQERFAAKKRRGCDQVPRRADGGIQGFRLGADHACWR
jgi:DNA invertase Pin-like site-specific DNA recombinase